MMRLTVLLKRRLSVSVVVCPYDQIGEADTVFLKRFVSVSVVNLKQVNFCLGMELHRVGSATNRATLSSFHMIYTV